jgi:glutaconate CoA-transferase subunit B
MRRVITELAIFDFDSTTRRMKPLALNHGVTAEQVQANTGFKLNFDSTVGVTEPPTEHELTTLRALDPEQLYIG